MLKALLRLIYQGRTLPILIYHGVLAEKDPMRPGEVTAEDFNRQLKWISECFRPITLRQALDGWDAGRLPPRALVITFDDGYANNAEIALPLLRRHGCPASFFCTTAFLDGGMMWNDRVIEGIRQAPGTELHLDWLGLGPLPIRSTSERALAARQILLHIKHRPFAERAAIVAQLFPSGGDQRPMMSEDQIRQLHRAGMEIGGHTRSHPILATMGEAEQKDEIFKNKRELETIIGEKIESFAYPNGKPGQDYDRGTITVLKEAGYRQAVTTVAGVSRAGDDPFQLRRFTPWRRDRRGFLLQLARNCYQKPALL